MTMRPDLTAVLILYRKSRINHHLRFGKPVLIIRRGWHRSLAVFKSGQVFGYVRWRANKYGTQDWQLLLMQACNFGPITRADGIIPGADMLLHTRGFVRTKRALNMLDALEKQGQPLDKISTNYWRHAHNALETARDAHAVTPLQSRSFKRQSQC